MNGKWLVAMAAVALGLALHGCDETDLGSVQCTVREDLSGRLAVVRIVPAESLAPEPAAGVTWDGTAGVVASVGEFKDLSAVRLADIGFAAGKSDAGLAFVKVTVPRGPQAKWPAMFLGASDEAVRKAAATLTDAQAAQNIGRTLKLTLKLPADVVSAGLATPVRGVQPAHQKGEATLVVPLDRGREDGAPIVWHVTWESKRG